MATIQIRNEKNCNLKKIFVGIGDRIIESLSIFRPAEGGSVV